MSKLLKIFLIIIFCGYLIVGCGKKEQETSPFEQTIEVIRPPIMPGPSDPTPAPTPTPYPSYTEHTKRLKSRNFNPNEETSIELPYKCLQVPRVDAGNTEGWRAFMDCKRTHRSRCITNNQVAFAFNIERMDFPNGMDSYVKDIILEGEFYLHDQNKQTELICIEVNQRRYCEGRNRGNVEPRDGWERFWQNLFGVLNQKFWKKVTHINKDIFWNFLHTRDQNQTDYRFNQKMRISLKTLFGFNEAELYSFIYENKRKTIHFIVADDVYVLAPTLEIKYVHDPWGNYPNTESY